MKTALVTGGAQGIGKGIVTRLRTDGWRVAVFDIDREAVGELCDADEEILGLQVDVGSEEDVARGFDALRGWLDGEPLNLLVSNAGLADPVSGPIEDLSLDGWRRWQDSHVTGAFLCIRAAVPLLRTGRGSIVTMSSTRAHQSEPQTEAYAAAKGALVALTHALAVSLGPAIRVNTILPGWIETGPWQKVAKREDPDHSAADRDQHPVGRVGRPEDVAGLVAWLASEEAGFVTGQQFVIDGGMSVRMIYAE
ncbi:SDR family NAD(P)-dependent oxidoreductase [Paracoccus beibuensis]|uniref:SDR family NAD(P)-dependent oxidoreductase n=1 Tax=Paracoccus beibuensis TaxID=547602 RepID=UPI00223FF2BF|nr:SDR family oxidoreductase [Paracoccus beibuensis]